MYNATLKPLGVSLTQLSLGAGDSTGPASWKCLLHFESTSERLSQAGGQGGSGMGRNILSA